MNASSPLGRSGASRALGRAGAAALGVAALALALGRSTTAAPLTAGSAADRSPITSPATSLIASPSPSPGPSLAPSPALSLAPSPAPSLVPSPGPSPAASPAGSSAVLPAGAPAPAPGSREAAAAASLHEEQYAHDLIIGAARNAVGLRNWTLAIERFERLLRHYAGDDTGRLEYAGVLGRVHRTSEAIAQLQILLTHQPDNRLVREMISGMFLELSDLPRAAEQMQWIVDRYPADLATTVRLADVHTWMYHYARARGLYDRVLAAHPGDLAATLGKAHLLTDVCQPEKAAALLESVAAPAVVHRDVQMALARAWAVAGSYARARPILERLLATDPGDVPAHLAYATLFESMEHYDQARAEFHKTLAWDPRNRAARIGIARNDVFDRHFQRAHAAARALVAERSDDPAALDVWCGALHGMGDDAKAQDEARQATRAHPTDPEIRMVLARALARGGKLDTGLAELDLALSPRIAADHSPQGAAQTGTGDAVAALAQIQHDVAAADVALSAGSPERALPVLEALLARAPGNLEAMVRRAEALRDCLDKRAKARAPEAFLLVLAADPQHTRARIGLARAYSWTKRFGEAYPQYDALGRQQAGDLVLEREVARVHFWDKGFAAARRLYDAALAADPDGALRAGAALAAREPGPAPAAPGSANPPPAAGPPALASPVTTAPPPLPVAPGGSAPAPTTAGARPAPADTAFSAPLAAARARLLAGAGKAVAGAAESTLPHAGQPVANALTPEEARVRIRRLVIEGAGGLALHDAVGDIALGLPAKDPLRVSLEEALAQHTSDAIVRELVRLEREANGRKETRPIDAMAYYRRLIDTEPVNDEARFDLGQCDAVLGFTHRACAMYRDVLRANPKNEPARIALHREELNMEPRLELDVSDFKQSGRGILADMRRVRAQILGIWPTRDEDEYVAAGVGHAWYSPSDDRTEEDDLGMVRAQHRIGDRLLAMARLDVESKPAPLADRVAADLGLAWLAGGSWRVELHGITEDVLENGETIRQGIRRTGARLSVSGRPTDRLALGAHASLLDYSDHDTQHELGAGASFNLTPAPRQLRLQLDYFQMGFGDGTVFTADPTSLRGVVHPYFAPSSFGQTSLGLVWRQWLTPDLYKGANERWYEIGYARAVDTSSQTYDSFSAAIHYDVKPCVSLQATFQIQRSDVYDSDLATFQAIVRF